MPASYIYLYYEYFYKNFYMSFKIEAKRSSFSKFLVPTGNASSFSLIKYIHIIYL